MAESELTPKFAPFLGMAGIGSAMIFGCKRSATDPFAEAHLTDIGF
jgi:hypothetical protein